MHPRLTFLPLRFRTGPKTLLRPISICWLTIAIPFAAALQADQPARLNLVYKLLHDSSAARQLSQSDAASAQEAYTAAKQLYEDALAAYQSGNEDSMNELLDAASRQMFEATRFAEGGAFSDSRKRADFDSRLESIEALSEAYERVALEKGADPKDALAKIEEQTIRAQKLLKEGKLDEARRALDDGYVTAKTSIDGLRGGDTLVRTLSFATIEEEYEYELDRNDTHKMLISVLIETREKSAASQSMTVGFVEKAASLRAEAESQAVSGEYERAIQTLEESTRNLIRAIRGAGIYIPG